VPTLTQPHVFFLPGQATREFVSSAIATTTKLDDARRRHHILCVATTLSKQSPVLRPPCSTTCLRSSLCSCYCRSIPTVRHAQAMDGHPSTSSTRSHRRAKAHVDRSLHYDDLYSVGLLQPSPGSADTTPTTACALATSPNCEPMTTTTRHRSSLPFPNGRSPASMETTPSVSYFSLIHPKWVPPPPHAAS
jgi:hypothetical protein